MKIEFIGLSVITSILKYNNLIIKFFEKNSDELLNLALILFLTGSVIWFVVKVLFDKYKFIRKYGSFAIYAAIWIFIITYTYLLYSATGKYYAVFLGIVFPIILYIKTTERYEKVRSFLTNSY